MKRLLMLVLLMEAVLMGRGTAQAQSEAREAGYLYLSPVPQAPFVSAQTRYVLVRFEDVTPSDVTNLTTDFITVTGTNSGPHTGVAHVASDGRTVIFEMSTDFSLNELVTVTLNPELSPTATGKVEAYEYQFAITSPVPGFLPPGMLGAGYAIPLSNFPAEDDTPEESGPVPQPAGGYTKASTEIMPNGVSVPSDFPQVVITVNNNPSPGYLFLDSGYPGDAPPYTMILDNNGLPIWYRRGRVWDFKIQKNGFVTWCFGDGGSLCFDQNFNYVQSYHTVNGYTANFHELEVLEDGTCLMLGARASTVDMSQYIPDAGTVSVIDWAIQEFTPAGELIFQWRAWDHYDIRDNENYDFPHMNALDVDEDGHILVSSRYVSEVTKINRDSGDIIWRLGGAKSSFAFVNDQLNGFDFQHDINALGHGQYTVFDNGNAFSHLVSRAVEYQLDLTNMTATLVWEFRDTPDKWTHWMGNAQRLPNGNTLINFGR